MPTQHTRTILLALSISACSGVAHGHDEGDWLIRGGYLTADLDETAGDINIADIDTIFGPSVDNDSQPGLTLGYMFARNWGVELLAAVPFEHDFGVIGTLRDPVPPFLDGGSFKQMPLTASLLWYPFGGQDRKFQPFIGAGFSYNLVWDENVDGDLEASLGRITEPLTGTDEPLRSDIDVDNTWGLSGRIGFDYMFTEQWGINASYWYVDLDTEATIKTELGNTDFELSNHANIWMLGITYEF